MPLKPIAWRIILAVAAAKLLFHLFTNVNYGFHRDEMLYLALGRHLDVGYWSNPPLLGWIAAFVQTVLGDSMFATRIIPSLFSTGILILTALMAREMGGGRYAQFLAGICILFAVSARWCGYLLLDAILLPAFALFEYGRPALSPLLWYCIWLWLFE